MIYADVVLPLPLYGTFTYKISHPPAQNLSGGMRVSVPFGKKNSYTALIIRIHEQEPTDYETREIISVLDDEPVVLPSQIELWNWISDYYMCPLGEVFKAAMPVQLDLLRKTRNKKQQEQTQKNLSVLNSYQEKALIEIKHAFTLTDVALLHGVTSSGKTEIYIHLIAEAIAKGLQVLYLLPEIALTTQIINRLAGVFGSRIAVYHSKFSNAERIKTWRKLLQYDKNDDQGIQIVLGVRSAVFLPFKNPGLIIIDEEHENTYKQFDPAPRYHARDTAIMMARYTGAKVLLGSATPSVESYHNCMTGKYKLIKLNERYLNIQLPEITVENTRLLRKRKKMQSHFSPALISNIEEALGNGEQVILFQNRRGFSLLLECDHCGEVPKCRNCDVSLTYHKKMNRLYCHYCGYSMGVPQICPSCNQGGLKMLGFGTEKIEEELALFFPNARIERLDIDSARSRKSYEKLIARFELGQSDILVGTQMVSKGLDFDNVRLVGVMNADNLINYPDFRAFERSYQLMAQVSGRAGRKGKRGKVIIQTADDRHPVIDFVVRNDYEAMYQDQVDERKKFLYPPFSRLVEITLKHRDLHVLDNAADHLAQLLKTTIEEKIMGPEYPLIGRIRNLYLKSLLIKISRASNLAISKQLMVTAIHEMKLKEEFRSVQITLDVDPY
jgi:primosomal protein N' (replication factor Y)